MDLDAFRWLLTEPGQRLLRQADEVHGGAADDLKAQAALRRTASSAHVAAALTQVELRRRAEEKFGDLAGRMYFTPEGLEQATRLPVATHRAARASAAGATTVIDLGCGIGGDLVAFARAGLTAAGVDLDPVRVAVAETNLQVLGLGGAVSVADATTLDTTPFDVAYADPARRSAAGRSFNVDEWTPPWSFVQALLARDSCVKLAPGIPHHLVPEGVEAEWVSDHREVKEAVLWSGRLATTRRRATRDRRRRPGHPDRRGRPGRRHGSGRRVPLRARRRGDPGRAGDRGRRRCRGSSARRAHRLRRRRSEAFRTPFARGYRVLEEVPYREKPLKAALRERGIGRLTIKKRGVSVVPDELRKRLSLRGDEESTLVLTRVAGKGTALLVEPR